MPKFVVYPELDDSLNFPPLVREALVDSPEFQDAFAPRTGSIEYIEPNELTAALASKQDSSAKGQANGYASLDASTKIPAAQIPDLATTYRKYVSAPTGVAATDTANIQSAINALSATGGTVVLQAGLYNLTSTGLTGTAAGVTIMGQGGTAQGVSLTWGATRLVSASAAGWAITWGTTGAGNANYAGLTLRDLQIVGNATASGGVWLKGQSNFRLNNVTITGYTAGTGLYCENAGSNSQYGELNGFQATDNQIGLLLNGSNGLRIIGGMFDGNHNAGSIRAGSTAIKVTAGDTLRLFGTVIQYYETGCDLAVGINPELHGVRFEGFTTAIKNAAPSTRVYGGSFNNSIVGLSGTAMNNLAGASNLYFEPGDVTQVATLISDAGIGTTTGYRPSPSGGDDKSILQSYLNSMGSNGGTVVLKSGTYLLNSTLVIPNKVTLRGQGRSATYLKAGGSFPINTALIQLGPLATDIPLNGYGFATKLENLTVDANGVSGSTGVYSERLQEQSGLFGVVVSNFKLHGINFSTAGNADFGMERCEVYPATGATYGVFFDGSAGSNYIKDCTIGVQGSLTAGVYVKSGTVHASSLHIEAATDGIVWEAANGSIHGITGPTTAANVTNLVRMLGSSRYVVGTAITKNSSTNAVKDEFFSRTINSAYVPLWVGGDGYIARLFHNGDQAGFYGTTPITKPIITGSRGTESAASTSTRAALVALGLVTDSTTA